VLDGTTEESAEKVDSRTSAAEAVLEIKAFNAALEALRHPKTEFSRSLWSRALPKTTCEMDSHTLARLCFCPAGRRLQEPVPYETLHLHPGFLRGQLLLYLPRLFVDSLSRD
jgi:hypothetical protein